MRCSCAPRNISSRSCKAHRQDHRRLVRYFGGQRYGHLSGNIGFQGLQQIAKLRTRSCQLLPDDRANRLPQAFICGCLAIDSLQRLLRVHAIADVDPDDLHIHKVPLFQLFGVKLSFLFVIFCLGVLYLFPARNLVWLTVSPEEALASGKGAC